MFKERRLSLFHQNHNGVHEVFNLLVQFVEGAGDAAVGATDKLLVLAIGLVQYVVVALFAGQNCLGTLHGAGVNTLTGWGALGDTGSHARLAYTLILTGHLAKFVAN